MGVFLHIPPCLFAFFGKKERAEQKTCSKFLKRFKGKRQVACLASGACSKLEWDWHTQDVINSQLDRLCFASLYIFNTNSAIDEKNFEISIL